MGRGTGSAQGRQHTSNQTQASNRQQQHVRQAPRPSAPRGLQASSKPGVSRQRTGSDDGHRRMGALAKSAQGTQRRDGNMLPCARIRDAKSLPELLEICHIQVQMGDLSVRDIKTLLSAHATCNVRVQAEVKRALEQHITRHVQTMSGRDVADLMWAYAKNGLRDEHAVKTTLHARAVTCMSGCVGKDVSMILWASAKLGWKPNEALWESIADQSIFLAEGFTPHGISNTLWAYATLRRTPGKVTGWTERETHKDSDYRRDS
jgi:molybdenum cofactor biosynthesis enzyme